MCDDGSNSITTTKTATNLFTTSSSKKPFTPTCRPNRPVKLPCRSTLLLGEYPRQVVVASYAHRCFRQSAAARGACGATGCGRYTGQRETRNMRQGRTPEDEISAKVKRSRKSVQNSHSTSRSASTRRRKRVRLVLRCRYIEHVKPTNTFATRGLRAYAYTLWTPVEGMRETRLPTAPGTLACYVVCFYSRGAWPTRGKQKHDTKKALRPTQHTSTASGAPHKKHTPGSPQPGQ